MTKKAMLSTKNRRMLEQFKKEAHSRVLKREFVQFRVDAQMMDLLLRVADYKRQPVGIMVREWVTHKLAQEAKLLPLTTVKLPNGSVLGEASLQRDVEKALIDYNNGRLKLSVKEYRALMDWLLDRHLANKYAQG